MYFYATYMFLCAFSWENKDIYARAVRNLRMRELENVECMTAVHAGLSSIIPLQLLTMLSPLEIELRTCGLPYINLEFLKVSFIVVSLKSIFLFHSPHMNPRYVSGSRDKRPSCLFNHSLNI